MKKIFILINLVMLIASLHFVSGCARKGTIGSGGYTHHFARYGEYNLISKNSDLYIEKADGSESKRLTFTPRFKENFAFIVGNSGYVAYSVFEGSSKIDLTKPNRYYIQNMDMGSSSRKRITEKEFNNYLLNH